MPQQTFFQRSPDRKVERRPVIPTGDISQPFLIVELERDKDEVLVKCQFLGQTPQNSPRPTGLSVSDINNLYGRMIDACSPKHGIMDVSTMASAAQIGHYLFTKLFDDEEQEKLRGERQKIQDIEDTNAQTFWLGELSPEKILVLSDRINIPWELLYLSDDITHAGIEEKQFLGSSFFVHQDLSSSGTTERYLIEKPFKRARGVRVFSDEGKYTLEEEAPMVVQLFADADAHAALAPSLDRELSGTGALAAAINDSTEDIIHLACHADFDEYGDVRIHVRESYVESGIALKSKITQSPVGPLVFLNACELSLTNSREYDTLISHLLQKRFAAVIATEIEVDSEIAWRFCNSVYEYFLNYSCRSIQRALFYGRRRLVRDHGSLIGYTYSYYGIRDLKFV